MTQRSRTCNPSFTLAVCTSYLLDATDIAKIIYKIILIDKPQLDKNYQFLLPRTKFWRSILEDTVKMDTNLMEKIKCGKFRYYAWQSYCSQVLVFFFIIL